jgi:hypothetical protein
LSHIESWSSYRHLRKLSRSCWNHLLSYRHIWSILSVHSKHTFYQIWLLIELIFLSVLIFFIQRIFIMTKIRKKFRSRKYLLLLILISLILLTSLNRWSLSWLVPNILLGWVLILRISGPSLIRRPKVLIILLHLLIWIRHSLGRSSHSSHIWTRLSKII